MNNPIIKKHLLRSESAFDEIQTALNHIINNIKHIEKSFYEKELSSLNHNFQTINHYLGEIQENIIILIDGFSFVQYITEKKNNSNIKDILGRINSRIEAVKRFNSNFIKLPLSAAGDLSTQIKEISNDLEYVKDFLEKIYNTSKIKSIKKAANSIDEIQKELSGKHKLFSNSSITGYLENITKTRNRKDISGEFHLISIQLKNISKELNNIKEMFGNVYKLFFGNK